MPCRFLDRDTESNDSKTTMIRVLALFGWLLPSFSTTPSGIPLREVASAVNSTRTISGDMVMPGDVLSVEFVHVDAPWDHLIVPVRRPGAVTFLGIDSLQIAGMTLDEIDAEFTRLCADQENTSDLSVSLVTDASHMVSVLGEVTCPGRYDIGIQLSLIEANSLSSGFRRDTARLDQILLVRWDSKLGRYRHWSIDASAKYWRSNAPLHDHDVVYARPMAAVQVNDWIDRFIRRNIPQPTLIGSVN